MKNFLRRYPATIALAALMLLALAALGWRWQQSRECKRGGGVYAQTFTGWECVR